MMYVVSIGALIDLRAPQDILHYVVFAIDSILGSVEQHQPKWKHFSCC
jgi:hypothetical protein